MKFLIEKELGNGRGRIGSIETKHGNIQTPAFIVVGTKATVKSLTTEQINTLGAQAVLANTYHLYLQPGDKILKKAGGIQNFMNWQGPTFTDSGGFQAFSLGAAFNNNASKIADRDSDADTTEHNQEKFAKVTEDGVEFRSVLDGSTHFFTPEKSIEIQHGISADIIFAFDECT
ncbi:MAG: tRNA guanosine(34) transglycosylase Tgt, partial [bacterium]